MASRTKFQKPWSSIIPLFYRRGRPHGNFSGSHVGTRARCAQGCCTRAGFQGSLGRGGSWGTAHSRRPLPASPGTRAASIRGSPKCPFWPRGSEPITSHLFPWNLSLSQSLPSVFRVYQWTVFQHSKIIFKLSLNKHSVQQFCSYMPSEFLKWQFCLFIIKMKSST